MYVPHPYLIYDLKNAFLDFMRQMTPLQPIALYLSRTKMNKYLLPFLEKGK